jgi:hypothetical protein
VEAPEPGIVLGRGETPLMGAPRKYPLELRERAVRLVFESGRPVRQVARDLGVLWGAKTRFTPRDPPNLQAEPCAEARHG